MKKELISLFEKMRIGETKNEILSPQVVNAISSWYIKYFEKCDDINKALDLMFYFYVHEDLDMYHVSEYHRHCNYLEETFSLPRDKVLDAIQSFRNIIYED